jgi:hypothetical protein
MMFALAITNGAAVAAAMCEHQNMVAHAVALQSPDEHVSGDAMSEEAAATAASKKGSFGDVAGSVAGYILPGDTVQLHPLMLRSMRRPMTDAAGLGSRSLRPLLEPPLA